MSQSMTCCSSIAGGPSFVQPGCASRVGFLTCADRGESAGANIRRAYTHTKVHVHAHAHARTHAGASILTRALTHETHA
jgi:hypothetical protein